MYLDFPTRSKSEVTINTAAIPFLHGCHHFALPRNSEYLWKAEELDTSQTQVCSACTRVSIMLVVCIRMNVVPELVKINSSSRFLAWNCRFTDQQGNFYCSWLCKFFSFHCSSLILVSSCLTEFHFDGMQGKSATVKTALLLCHMESWRNTIYDANNRGRMLLDW